MYVIFEGVDTAGKSTQIELLKSNFPEIIATKEPAGTEFGKWAREILLNGELKSKRAETLLFLADRAEHYQEVIKPNRASKLIISDRGFISGIAYALANGEDFETLIELNSYAMEGDLPDLVVLFEIDESILRERLSQKSQDSIEKRGIEYILKVQDNLKKTLKRLKLNYKVVYASKSIEQLQKELIDILGLKEKDEIA